MLDLPTLLAVLFVGFAALTDAQERRVPNPLVLAGLLLCFGGRAQVGGLHGLGDAALGATAGFLGLLPLWALRQMGGGDVKIVMVCGAALGWSGAAHVVLLGTAVHGVLSAGMAFRAWFARTMGEAAPPAATVPHALGFAAATWAYTAGFGHLF
ncbi:MAG: prepilin peptidase [Deltaproteobacteria bacterium]|nr:prepilin peptidase [Deltaproteobacteria bacterium]